MVKVRRRWSDHESLELPAEVLWDLHYRDEAGGVCRALPRAFLWAHVWCDQIVQGAFGHVCRDDPAPHDLVVCILRHDNTSATYESLLQKTRR